MGKTPAMLYQHGTLGALMAGLFEGTSSIGSVLEHGDLGIGTLNALDGELIILDGIAYQAQSDNTLRKMEAQEKVPYAAVTKFVSDRTLKVEHKMDSDELKQFMIDSMKSKNAFHAFCVKGNFEKMHIRIMPKQEKPYPRLVKVSDIQPEYTKENVSGTIMGFYTPELFQGVACAGFHLHFIDDAHTFGGHILDYTINSGTVEVQTIESLVQHFQVEDSTFLQTEFDDTDLHAEIESAEG